MDSIILANCRTILTRDSGACCTSARTTTTDSATMSARFEVWMSCISPRRHESVSEGIHAATRPIACPKKQNHKSVASMFAEVSAVVCFAM